MAIKGFGMFMRLLRAGHTPDQLGLQGSTGNVTRWEARHKLARNFRGLQVDELSDETLKGYNAFLQVFLTHSAMELYVPLVRLDDKTLETHLAPFEPEKALREFFQHDRSGQLFDFLHERLNPKLKARLTACREGQCANIFHVSASIRHIFAHGHLTAHSNKLKPARIAKACLPVSTLLLDFMDADFTRRVTSYWLSLNQSTKQGSETGSPLKSGPQ